MTNILLILSLLILPFFLLAPVPSLKTKPHLRARIGLALVFFFTSLGHFIAPGPMSQMIPPQIPFRVPLIYITGVIEAAAAVALLLPTTSRAAGWFIILMLIALLPFNIYAAANRIPFGGHHMGPAYLLVRIPLQLVLMAWAYRSAAAPRRS